MNKYDAIIIGSGIGGLISAGVLSAKGLRVLVLEKHTAAGGYIGSFKRNGFLFDSSVDCVAGLEPGGAITKVLDMMGVSDQLRVAFLDPIRESIFPDHRITVAADYEGYRENLTKFFYSEKEHLNAFFKKLDHVYGLIQGDINDLFLPKPSCKQLKTELLSFIQRSYSELLDDFFTDGRLKAVLSDRCPFIGLPPSEVSAIAMTNIIMSYFKSGAARPLGGFQILSDLFVEGIRKSGGDVCFKKNVTKIVVQGNKCKGVKCADGQEYFSNLVISNADYAHTFGELIGGAYKNFAQLLIESPGVTSSFFILYAGITGIQNGASSVGYFPSYNMESFFAPDMPFRDDSTLGFTIASIDDSTRAPSGCSTVVVHEMITSNCQSINKQKAIESIVRRSGAVISNFDKRIVALDAATPDTLRTYTNNYNGAAFGWRQISGFRKPASHGISNLYIASHWGEYGGGVLASAYSGLKVAFEILKKEGVNIVG